MEKKKEKRKKILLLPKQENDVGFYVICLVNRKKSEKGKKKYAPKRGLRGCRCQRRRIWRPSP